MPSIAYCTNSSDSFTDSYGNIWAIAGNGGMLCNNKAVQYSANVSLIMLLGETVWQYGNSEWYAYAPSGRIADATTLGAVWAGPLADTPLSSLMNIVYNNRFSVAGGQIIAPDGRIFIAKGINVLDWQTQLAHGNPGNGTDSNAAYLLTSFPGINFVRLAVAHGFGQNNLTLDVSSYNDDPENFAKWIQALTGYNTAGQITGTHHAVVVIEDHRGDNPAIDPASVAGQQQIQWYKNCARYYLANPYVWFGCVNEPTVNQTQINDEIAIYQAVRGVGNNNPILLTDASQLGNFQLNNGTTAVVPGTAAGYTSLMQTNAAAFAAMTNVMLDMHCYSWCYGGEKTTVSQTLANNYVTGSLNYLRKLITSKDGVLPVIIGEYGTSTNGATVDASGTVNVVAAQSQNINGCVAWCWFSQSPGADNLTMQGTLTSYGKDVASYLAGKLITSWQDTDNS